MAKEKTVWFCTDCGNESSRWQGKCPGCGNWNTLVEEKIDTRLYKKSEKVEVKDAQKLNEVKKTKYIRIDSGFEELNRVLGGGFTEGSLTLIGGEPGIGKSTLILQVCETIDFNKEDENVLYISGEESMEQIKMRADRLNVKRDNIYFLGETDIDKIEITLEKIKPKFLIIDSIQTMYSTEISSAPGSVSQVREATSRIMRMCKAKGITTIIVGHVTKEGSIAGPRVLEHMVDTVLYIEGERYLTYRILRAVKNRFGSTDEIGMFEMQEKGLVEIENPATILLEDRQENAIGTATTISAEGSRCIMVELQALTTQTIFGMPRRNATGLDYNKITLLLAVLEKHAKLNFSNQDVYMNIAGGIKINEPAIDLGIIAACSSSFKSIPIDRHIVITGEVGLTGEVRPVNMIEKRIKEAEKLGFKQIIIPTSNYNNLKNKKDYKIKISPVKNIYETLRVLQLI